MDEGYRLFPIPFMRTRGTLQRELVLRVAPAAREAVVRDLLARWPYRS